MDIWSCLSINEVFYLHDLDEDTLLYIYSPTLVDIGLLKINNKYSNLDISTNFKKASYL